MFVIQGILADSVYITKEIKCWSLFLAPPTGSSLGLVNNHLVIYLPVSLNGFDVAALVKFDLKEFCH